MKKNISLIVILFLVGFSAANAQIAAGTKAVGAGFGFKNQRYEHGDTKYRNTELNGSLSGSYFLFKNFSLGFEASINKEVDKEITQRQSMGAVLGEEPYYTTTTTNKIITPNINIVTRYYYSVWDNKLFAFGQGFAGLGQIKTTYKYEGNDPYHIPTYYIVNPYGVIYGSQPNQGNYILTTPSNTTRTNTYSAGVNFGLAYFVTPKFSLETSVLHFNYINYRYKDKPANFGKYTSHDYNYGLIGNVNLSLQYYF